MLRIQHKQELRMRKTELSIELTRSFMALFANANRDSKRRPTPYEPKDFYTLSYDKKLDIAVDPDLMDKMKKKFGSKIKNNG